MRVSVEFRAATWLDDLRPAAGAAEFFFEAPLRELEARGGGSR